MKRIILITIFILVVFSSFAQRLNEHGLKMVSEIEVLNERGSGEKICYEYEQNGKLKAITVYSISEDKSISMFASFRMQGNKIIRKHNGYLDRFNDCVFGVDSNRHIVRYVVTPTNPKLQDYGYRWEMTYQYGYDTIYNRWYLSSDRYKEYYYDNANREYVFNHEGIRNNVEYKEGIIIKSYDIDEYYDLTRRNDINISLSFIFLGFNHFWDDYYFMMTEWIDCREEFLLKDTLINNYEYVYQNGNLSKIKENGYGGLKIVNIKYLY